MRTQSLITIRWFKYTLDCTGVGRGAQVADVMGESGDQLDLAVAWPAAARSVGALLRALGVPGDASEEIVAEVALRAVQRPGVFESPLELRRWVRFVARNLVIDRYRRHQAGSSATPTDPVLFIDIRDPQDPAEIASQRSVIEQMRREIKTLSPAERGTLAAAISGKQMSGTERVRLHRLRDKLRAKFEGVAAWVAGSPLGRLIPDNWGRAATGMAAAVPFAAAAMLGGVGVYTALEHEARGGADAQPVAVSSSSIEPLSRSVVSDRVHRYDPDHAGIHPTTAAEPEAPKPKRFPRATDPLPEEAKETYRVPVAGEDVWVDTDAEPKKKCGVYAWQADHEVCTPTWDELIWDRLP